MNPPKVVLHVGCGGRGARLPDRFEGYEEVRLDIDPGVRPDVVASIADMRAIPDAGVDAVFSAHNLEHLHSFEVPKALAEFRRVLKPGGLALILVPDLEGIARAIVAGRIEDELYRSPAGPIRPLDMLFGLQWAVEAGNPHMAHRTGFTAASLAHALLRAGFGAVSVATDGLQVTCEARR